MDYQLSCYISLSSAPEGEGARDKLLKAVRAFEAELQQAGIGYALDLMNIRMARNAIHSVHAGPVPRGPATETEKDAPTSDSG